MGQAPDLHLFQGALSHYLILECVAEVVLGCPHVSGSTPSSSWSSPNGIPNFQFGPCLNLKLDQPVKSHPQARQPLRKPHSSTLSEDMFSGKSFWTCCQRCHQTLQERTSKRKQVTELYADFMIQPQSCVYKTHSFTLDCFLLRPGPIKESKLDMAKHVLCPFLFFF